MIRTTIALQLLLLRCAIRQNNIVITDSPDLVVSLSVNTTLVDPNEFINLETTVRNQGKADASSSTTLRYYVSSDAIISSDDEAIDTNSVRSLQSGSSDDKNYGVRVPNKPGQYYYYACVDSVEGEDNTENNCSDFVTVTVRGEETWMPDAGLREAIRHQLGLNPDETITQHTMTRLTFLDLASVEPHIAETITNLTGLEYAKNLKELTINSHDSQISDITPLQNLKSLTVLALMGTKSVISPPFKI